MKRSVSRVVSSCELLANVVENMLAEQGYKMTPGLYAARHAHLLQARQACGALRMEEFLERAARARAKKRAAKKKQSP